MYIRFNSNVFLLRYENSSGFGAPLMVYLHLIGQETIRPSAFKGRETVFMLGLCALLSGLESSPWTYGVASIIAAAGLLARKIYFDLQRRTASHPMALNGQGEQYPPFRFRRVLLTMLLSLLLVFAPVVVPIWFSTFSSTALPAPLNPGSPFLEILVLSYPRPNVVASSAIIEQTLTSYLPFLSPAVTLSVFTHTSSHTAFTQAKESYANTNITFYMDTDTHAEFDNGQYLHLAEAFRWESERNLKSQAEWLMLVEDDFPVCNGEVGWDAISRVMNILESSRAPGERIPDRRAGFVATGGR